MIKAISSDGRTIVLGLSHRNLERLRGDQPILADLGELGMPGLRIIVFTGPTEEQMEAALAPLLKGAIRYGPGPVPGAGG